MANKMLIDASHEEETRVVVVRGNRIEEFDFESEHKKQLKGNIYLAKVTRVEPSLQAAFIDYGGNRHGFLAFSEIHPDYYQIPKADRQALIEEELARAAEEDDEIEPAKPARSNRRRAKNAAASDGEEVSEVVETADVDGDESEGVRTASDHEASTDEVRHGASEEADGTIASPDTDEASKAEAAEGASSGDEAEKGAADEEAAARRRSSRRRASGSDDASGDDEGNGHGEDVDRMGAEDALEEVPVRKQRSRRQYKIQEVIKRRQIILVQVVKEERGNKGAALTTYLSLAGRYSVLMPNTARGGGISRKITNATDRKRLKDVVRDLAVPRGMGIILRTAGANRTKAEVKRDYEYLMRLWETVRTVTLSSIAPALVYEEGSLIKRSIRDLYNKDIDQILVAGEAGYREAKDFMRMLMPSQAKVVQPYRDQTPIFSRQGIEAQLEKMVHPNVTLKSGGYIIINQTEALVAIDVNSGRSTREHSIEDTAYQTNLEAAEEIARQLRLRDLAGLIVVDFIDMEEKRNNRAVEKKLKECLKNDRARIQVGSISHFGLLEMSRQRIRASVLESTMQPCPVCEGTGHVRSASSSALHVLRSIEEHLQKHSRNDLHVKVSAATALYVLNEKRRSIDELERLYGLRIFIEAAPDAGIHSVEIVHGAEALSDGEEVAAASPEAIAALDAAEEKADETAAREAAANRMEERSNVADKDDSEESDNSGRRRRRRRRRGRRNDDEDVSQTSDDAQNAAEASAEDDAVDDASERDEDEQGRKRRRRGRRGGRRNRDVRTGEGNEVTDTPELDSSASEVIAPEPVMAESSQEREDVAEEAMLQTSGEAANSNVAMLSTPEPMTENLEQEAVAVEGTDEKSVIGRDILGDDEVEAAPAAASVPVANADERVVPSQSDAPEEPYAEQEVEATPEEDLDPPARELLHDPVVTSSDPVEEKKPRRTGWWARRLAR